MYNNINLSH